MAKILVINSPLFKEKNPLYDEDSLPPIGLGLIATALQNRGHDVVLIDAIAEQISLLDLVKQVKEERPDFVALNAFTTNILIVKEFLEFDFGIEFSVIIGGLSMRALYNNIFDWHVKGFLYIVFGDGESITPDIVENKVAEPPNIERENKKYYIVNTSSVYYNHSIDDIPLNRDFFKNEPTKHPLGFWEAYLVTSRGCIYNCAFCGAAKSANKDLTVREMGENSIIKNLLEIEMKYPNVESIRVLDDLFLKNSSTLKKAIRIFSKFDFKWRATAHVMTFKDVGFNDLVRLKSAGCTELFIGIESGSPSILRKIHKTHDVEKIKSMLSLVLRAGISIKAYFIYGFPGETMEDFEQTLVLATYLKEQATQIGVGFRTSVFQFRPYHGSELFNQLNINQNIVQSVASTEPNTELSELVGRSQFNFYSGNYSTESIDVVHEYIYKTMKLNNLN